MGLALRMDSLLPSLSRLMWVVMLCEVVVLSTFHVHSAADHFELDD